MCKRNTYWTLFVTAFIGMASCSDSEKQDGGGTPFDPSLPIAVDGFYPDSGGIATPMIVNGSNFGTDTTGMKVYFEDVDGVKHPAGVVSSNGSKIYLFVPSGLTYKREMNLLVERKLPDGKEFVGKAKRQFMYKTETTVTTVVGQAAPGNTNIPTVGGDLASTTFSSPTYICLDDEDNIFITERSFDSQMEGRPYTFCRNEKGDRSPANIVMASLRSNATIPLLYNATYVMNAPAFSDEKDNETVYIPDDAGVNYYVLSKSLSYAPRYQRLLKTDKTADIDTNNWKHCFVVNKKDHNIYTVMHKGQLVRVNPRTRIAEVLLTKISTAEKSDAYVAFSPVEGKENILYIALADQHQLWTVDVSALEGKDKATYHGEPYAGKAILEGKVAGKGWEDGLLKNAKFNYPRQVCFTEDGKLYIADSGNSCIRVINTEIPKEQTTVTTPIGLPGAHGYKDGGPDIAKFDKPCGVAVSTDGRIVYVADTNNKVIRKLAIE